MADALVSPLLEQITTIITQQVQEEVKLVVGVEKEVQKLNSNLLAVQAVLEDAERRQLKEAAVRDWINKLKEVFYDIDDVLDEWSTVILKRQTENEPDSKKMVRSFLPSPCSCFQKVIHRHDIALKIKEITERLDVIAKERAMYGFELYKAIEETERLISTSFVDESSVIGRDDDKETIVSMLLSGSSHEAEEVNVISIRSHEAEEMNVISIVGMGGIGKTTLAQLAYNDDDVQAYFEERIWVCVSDPFDETRIAKAIIEALAEGAPNLIELQSLLHSISKSIKGKKFLLVLDDVWTEDYKQWEPLKLSLKVGAPGSRILVTTRKDTVATMIGTNHRINLTELSQEVCWSIFSQMAFHKRSEDECERLTEIGQKIADKCKGLPLAAKVLGGLMQFKRTREEWEHVLSSELWELEHVERDIFTPLLLSYYDLPAVVRRCFIYCAMFPKDYQMDKDQLIKIWMAQGYLKESRSRDMELVGEQYLETLVARSFFQDIEEYEPQGMKFKMHDIVHDFAQFLTKNECLMVDVNNLEESYTDTSYERFRHSTLNLSKEGHFPVSICKAKNLRSLFVIQNVNLSLGATLPDLFKQLTCLRSLDLSRTSIQEIPSEVMKLIHLRYLNLVDCETLESLPETICNLCNLQSLDVSWCNSLKELPQTIGKLTKLRHLEIDNSGVAFIPKGIERLSFLRTLDCFTVCSGGESESKAAKLGELKNLNHLRGSLSIEKLGNMVDVSEAKKAELKNKKHLHHLGLRFDGKKTELQANEDALIEALQPRSDLGILNILEYSGMVLPKWMMSLARLTELRLRDCGNLEVLPPLGRLPNLEILYLDELKLRRLDVGFLGIQNVDNTCTNEGEIARVTVFPKLRHLNIRSLEELEEWDGIERRVEETDITTSIIMPQLRALRIWNCQNLRALPDYVLTASLQRLKIAYCPILRKRYKEGEMGAEWHKTSHIPSVDIDGWVGNRPPRTEIVRNGRC